VYLSYICALIPFTSGSTGLKVLAFTPCDAGIAQQPTTTELTLSPLPATKQLTLSASAEISHASIEVFDALGRLVPLAHINSSPTAISFDVHELSDGVYFIRLSDAHMRMTKRFVKVSR
jgi:hypothetical protein